MEQTAAPTGVIDTLWPYVHAILTPELVGAVAVTLAGTHLVKIIAEHALPHVTDSAAHWRAFCASSSVVIGTASGLVTFLLTDAAWYLVPIVALGSGPAWRILQVLIPSRRLVDAFLTSTDRKYRRKNA